MTAAILWVYLLGVVAMLIVLEQEDRGSEAAMAQAEEDADDYGMTRVGFNVALALLWLPLLVYAFLSGDDD